MWMRRGYVTTTFNDGHRGGGRDGDGDGHGGDGCGGDGR